MGGPAALAVTLLLLVVSGFLVASDIALVGARRHRLEQAAAARRRGARAGLNGVRELSLMLAGAQLGITMCIVGLGMISEPALHHLFEPPAAALGLPDVAADAVALVLALSLVTFLHVVIGEMAPKSWAIAHPESSAMLLAPAFRAFTWAVRWLLVVLNGMSNALLRLFGVTPRNTIVNVRNREQIHHLVEESERLGLISAEDHGLLTRALDAPTSPVGDFCVPADHRGRRCRRRSGRRDRAGRGERTDPDDRLGRRRRGGRRGARPRGPAGAGSRQRPEGSGDGDAGSGPGGQRRRC